MNNVLRLDSFKHMDFPSDLLDSLTKLNYTTPTPIQAQTIPLALSDHDILGSAQTGTGKTLAFVLPLIAKLLRDPKQVGLVLTPTRELSEQIVGVIKNILNKHKTTIKLALLIGGEPIFKQLKQLKANPRIIVGTPGRVIDHLKRKTLVPRCSLLILDETDRMFDMGFGIQLENIIRQLPKERQTLMFSATLPKNIEKLASNYLNHPTRIAIKPEVDLIPKLTAETIKLKSSEKLPTLLSQLARRDGTTIIFVKTKYGAEVLSRDLLSNNHKVSYIHGDLKQSKRYKVMNDFRSGRYRIMVATDVAARGLDIPHIQHVINYDIPNCPEDYVHRIGRTARAGAEGSALNLVCFEEQNKWNAIQRFIDPEKSEKTKREFIFGKKNTSNFKFKEKKHFNKFNQHDANGKSGRSSNFAKFGASSKFGEGKNYVPRSKIMGSRFKSKLVNKDLI